jgi:pyrroline-5-carboxylate reductase
LGPVIQESQLVLSIAAGIPSRFIEKFLAKGVPVIRIMPNTPALVGMGAGAVVGLILDRSTRTHTATAEVSRTRHKDSKN